MKHLNIRLQDKHGQVLGPRLLLPHWCCQFRLIPPGEHSRLKKKNQVLLLHFFKKANGSSCPIYFKATGSSQIYCRFVLVDSQFHCRKQIDTNILLWQPFICCSLSILLSVFVCPHATTLTMHCITTSLSMFLSMSVLLSVCLSTCHQLDYMSTFVCLPVCLSTYHQLGYISTCLSVCVCIPTTWLYMYLHVCLPT